MLIRAYYSRYVLSIKERDAVVRLAIAIYYAKLTDKNSHYSYFIYSIALDRGE
ncbi:hypothetical protein KSC_048830 [Ktedonobacter sp. SOSP1-52]|nr:hypothetical protein KSC_048830 [Ktedonobacter sp. SOSP1-52]